MKRPSELLVVWMLVGACGPHEPASRDGELGAVSLAAVGSAHDVTQVAFSIVEPAGNCTTGPVVASGTIPLHPGALGLQRQVALQQQAAEGDLQVVELHDLPGGLQGGLLDAQRGRLFAGGKPARR